MDSSKSITRYLSTVVVLAMVACGGLAWATVPPTTNFAKATVSTGYNSAATSIVVSAGQGAKFSASGTYPLVWWNCTDYALSEDDPNVEIVLVTARSTDTLTVTRGQDGTSAVNHNTAGKTYCLVRSIVKYDIDAIRTELGAAGGSITDVTDAASLGFNATVTALCGSSNPAVLRLSDAQTVASNISLCANVKLWRIGSGKLTVSGGATVTLDSPAQILMPYRETLFDGASTQPVVFTNPGTVFPEWWNWNSATSAVNGTTRFKMMIDSLPANAAKASVIDFGGTTYLYDDKIPTNSRNIWLKGLNKFASHVLLTGTGSAKHGIYCTGSTKFLRVTDLDWSPQTPHTADNVQSGIRCDGDGDAPTMPTGAILEVWDTVLNGWNIGVSGDGDDSMKLARVTVLRSEITVGGTGSLSAINEGIDILRAELLKAEENIIDGDNRADHCIYALSVRSLNFKNNTCKDIANEALKVVSISSPASGPDPRLWMMEGNTVTGSGECAVINTDQDDIVHLVSLVNLVCDGATGSGSDVAAVTIVSMGTSRLKTLKLDGMTCSNSIHECIHLTAVTGASIDAVSATDLHFYNWSTSSTGSYSAINADSTGNKGLFKYDGYFDGNSNGRQVLATGFRTVWERVDAGAVRQKNLTLPDENILTAQLGTSQTFGRVQAAIARNVTSVGTPTGTAENTLVTLPIPGRSLCADGKIITFEAVGEVAANANTKTIRFKVGSTTIISNDVTTAPNSGTGTGTYYIRGTVTRIGANQQRTFATMMVGNIPQTTKIIDTAETEANDINLSVTGQDGTSSANDIVHKVFRIDYGN